MPRPTPPDKVLKAAKTFARENFGLQHRYAMALHTDQEHPHVHLVVKAEGQDGRRLHIDKAMLRDWREQFAQLMRDQGIAQTPLPVQAPGAPWPSRHLAARCSAFGLRSIEQGHRSCSVGLRPAEQADLDPLDNCLYRIDKCP